MIAKLLNNAISKYPYTWADFMADNNNSQGLNPADLLTIFPQTDMAKQGYSAVEVVPVAQPVFDLITQSCTEGTPALISEVWTQTWSVTALDASAVKTNQDRQIQENNTKIKGEIAELDLKRIRPLAEGDAAFLATINVQITTLRGQLK